MNLSRAAPVRCTAPHPDAPSRSCNARLLDAVRESIDVREGEDVPPGCIAIRCWRCGTKYVVCVKAA